MREAVLLFFFGFGFCVDTVFDLGGALAVLGRGRGWSINRKPYFDPACAPSSSASSGASGPEIDRRPSEKLQHDAAEGETGATSAERKDTSSLAS